jgi:hypothetical protein
MHGEGMEAAEELLPIGVRFGVEFDEPWQKDERCAECQRGDPG